MAREHSGNNPLPPAERPIVERHVYGPRPVGALIPAVTRPAFKARAPGVAQVMADWAEIVGPQTAATATPRRLSRGTLTLACAGPVAMELQHLANPLMERINGHLGRVLVERLRFVQDVTPPAPPAAPPRRRKPVQVELPGIPPGELRDALTALGQSIAQTRSARDRA